jgi:hypothetical protein
MRLSPLVPGFLRRIFLHALRKDPRWLERTAGTTLVTSVGMFGMGAGWAVGIVPLHTLCLTVGGITRMPGFVDGCVEPREYLALTASIDHDIVDGAPAARFARHLRDLIERAELLQESRLERAVYSVPSTRHP